MIFRIKGNYFYPLNLRGPLPFAASKMELLHKKHTALPWGGNQSSGSWGLISGGGTEPWDDVCVSPCTRGGC